MWITVPRNHTEVPQFVLLWDTDESVRTNLAAFWRGYVVATTKGIGCACGWSMPVCWPVFWGRILWKQHVCYQCPLDRDEDGRVI